MLISMVVLVGLLGLGGMAMLSVRGGASTASHERFTSMALCAAESGAAVAMDYLHTNIDTAAKWGAYVSANNDDPPSPVGIPGNKVKPGVHGNLFSAGMQSWYEIAILNNTDDPLFATGGDGDAYVIIRVTGHGPDGSVAQVEVAVQANDLTNVGRPCPAYAQRGMAEDGAGRNDCLTAVNTAVVATYRPGDTP
jgi:hypothetical protein